jgi:hypothetical protein
MIADPWVTLMVAAITAALIAENLPATRRSAEALADWAARHQYSSDPERAKRRSEEWKTLLLDRLALAGLVTMLAFALSYLAFSAARRSKSMLQMQRYLPAGRQEPELSIGLSLSLSAVDAYLPLLAASLDGLGMPFRWTLEELTKLRRRAEINQLGASATPDLLRGRDLLAALCEALMAKTLIYRLGGSQLELRKLQATYRREVGCWPRSNSFDALLIDAAAADIKERYIQIMERHTHDVQPLGALARYMIGLAAMLEADAFQEGDLLAEWIAHKGHQLSDARQYYNQRRGDPVLHAANLGNEPGCEQSRDPLWITGSSRPR